LHNSSMFPIKPDLFLVKAALYIVKAALCWIIQSITNILSVKVYIYSIVFHLQDKFRNNFPIFYSISIYIYSEYLAISYGELSKNMRILIGLYVLFYYSDIHLMIYVLLIINASFREQLIKGILLKDISPRLYKILLDISSAINSVIIFYFLDHFFFNYNQTFISKDLKWCFNYVKP